MSENMTYSKETVLDRRTTPQPDPRIFNGGDCGACVLSGLFKIPVPQVYQDYQKDSLVKPFSWWDMRQAIWDAYGNGILDSLNDRIPFWQTIEACADWGNPSWSQGLAWGKYISMALDAGFYPVCSVNYEKKGPFQPVDHWVLVVGHREVRTPNYKDGKLFSTSIETQILVSCSASSPQGDWIEVQDFLTHRGGYNALLARPARG